MAHIAIAGAGFSGAVIARQLAEAGHSSTVFESRDHIGGNCHTERNKDGILVHKYGPHIFHTENERVWEFINRFGEMVAYRHTVRTTVGDRVYSLPINLHTINQVFEQAMSPKQAQDFVAELGEFDPASTESGQPENFEQQALSLIGRKIYELFFEGYTIKQWGTSPTRLPASILKRLPVRFNYNDSYFNHPHQAMPRNGYTEIVASILEHDLIDVRLSEALDVKSASNEFDHIIWTGPLDAFFDFAEGRLSYRTLDFEEFESEGDFQGIAVMNYGDTEVAHTRITEHKHFAPWENHDRTVCFKEFSRAHEPEDIPYYPVRLLDDKTLLEKYVERANSTTGVSFVGRLATYRYLDMDVAISEALQASDAIIKALDAAEAPSSGETNSANATSSALPAFFVEMD